MPREGTKMKKLEWEKYKFDAPDAYLKKCKFRCENSLLRLKGAIKKADVHRVCL